MHWGSIFVETKLKDMNRIIIVGNGFDLAHGLKTKYEHFINWYWGNAWKKLQKCITFVYKDDLLGIKLKYSGYCISDYFQATPQSDNIYKYIVSLQNGDNYVDNVEISPFLERISKSIKTKGWVDIEADYYKMLVECKGKKDELERLNKDLVVIQGLLVKYLKEIQKNEIKEELVDDDIKSKMLAPFVAKDFSVEAKDKWHDFLKRRLNDSDLIDNIELYKPFEAKEVFKSINEFKNAYKDQIEFMGVDSIYGAVLPHEMMYPDEILFLNFNYTTTADLYMPEDPHFILNHIHGELAKPENVIFGYGDESDDEYKRLQKINDNEYLRHIKTNRYLETPNYRDLLSFIDSAPFQVCIMGHSCGLSDKTLLNTLFEHKNCVSIKPYYYVNEQGKDNYLDIVQNISRNFTNPQLMRDRVVNKTYCEELPQVTRNKRKRSDGSSLLAGA